MANPFVQSPTIPNMNMQSIRNMYQALINSRNPQELFMSMARQNPQLRPIAQALSQGVSPQQLFNQMCQQRNINPQEFINNIRNNNA